MAAVTLSIIGDWNSKLGSQEKPGVTGKFGLGIWNEAGQRLIEFFQEKGGIVTKQDLWGLPGANPSPISSALAPL